MAASVVATSGPGGLQHQASDVLVHIYTFLLKMSERGLDLPLAVCETVTYEHHFPRAWYYLEHKPTTTTDLATAAASGDGRKAVPGTKAPATHQQGLFASVPYVLKKRPARQCGSKAICESFAPSSMQGSGAAASGTRRDTRGGGVVAQVLQRGAPPHSAAAGSAYGTPTWNSHGRSPTNATTNLRDGDGSDTAAAAEVRVDYLGVDGLQHTTINAPETCALVKFLPPERSMGIRRSDAVYVTFTPTVVNVERRLNKNRYDDINITSAAARACTSDPDYSETASCSPLLADAARVALNRLAWFIEAIEGRRVLELRAVVKPRNGVLWLVYADRLLLSPYANPDPRHEIRFGALAANAGDSAAGPGAATMVQDVDWDEVEAEVTKRDLRLRLNRRSTKMSPNLSGKHDADRAASYGEWPSFCRIQALTPDVIEAVDRKLAAILAPRHGGLAPSVVTVKAPRALTATASPSSFPALAHAEAWAAKHSAAGASTMTPLSLANADEAVAFWCDFDACLAQATAAEECNEPSGPPQRAVSSDRRLSVGSLHSSRSCAIRDELGASESRVSRKMRRQQQLAVDIAAHVSDLTLQFNIPPAAQWGYTVPAVRGPSRGLGDAKTTAPQQVRQRLGGSRTTVGLVSSARDLDGTDGAETTARASVITHPTTTTNIPRLAVEYLLQDLIYAAYQQAVAAKGCSHRGADAPRRDGGEGGKAQDDITATTAAGVWQRCAIDSADVREELEAILALCRPGYPYRCTARVDAEQPDGGGNFGYLTFAGSDANVAVRLLSDMLELCAKVPKRTLSQQ